MKNKYFKHFLGILILIYLIFCFVDATFVEPNMLNIKTLTFKNQQLKGLKIVVASDLHLYIFQEKRLIDIINKINAQNPDIVLLLGDFVNGHSMIPSISCNKITEYFKNINSKYGVYAIIGNHDIWYDKQKIINSIEKANIKILLNENINLCFNNKHLTLAGIDDFLAGYPNVNKALKNSQNPIILMSHNPDIFPQITNNVDLILAGHTHGGQIVFKIFNKNFILYVPSKYGSKYAYGLFNDKNKTMYVTNGIGTSVLPIRFNCIPEIVVINYI
jgi:hypothetical protein